MINNESATMILAQTRQVANQIPSVNSAAAHTMPRSHFESRMMLSKEDLDYLIELGIITQSNEFLQTLSENNGDLRLVYILDECFVHRQSSIGWCDENVNGQDVRHNLMNYRHNNDENNIDKIRAEISFKTQCRLVQLVRI